MNTIYNLCYSLLLVITLVGLLGALYAIGRALAKMDAINDDDNWPHGGATGGA